MATKKKRRIVPPGSVSLSDAARRAGETDGDRELAEQAQHRLMQIAQSNGDAAYDLTDDGNVSRLIAVWGSVIRYCPAARSWRVFEDGRWATDDADSVEAMARAITQSIAAEVAGTPPPPVGLDRREEILGWARSCQADYRRRAIMNGARARLGFDEAAFDPPATDPLLNVGGGTIDLRTGQLHPADSSQSITKRVAARYDPGATCPEWERLVRVWMCGRDDLVRYLRLAIGASLIPGLVDRSIYTHYGPRARNGKSTFFRAVYEVLGRDYAAQIDGAALCVERARSSHGEDLSGLVGRRLVYASEFDESQSLDTRLVERLTGNDPLALRRIYGRAGEYRPTWTIHVLTNRIPRVANLDTAMRDRLKIIPWDFQVPEDGQVTGLALRLVEHEGSGILNWLIGAARDAFRQGGVGLMPAEVRFEGDDFAETTDLRRAWLHSGRVSLDPVGHRVHWTTAAALYEDFRAFCYDQGEPDAAGNPFTFGQWLNTMGIERKKQGDQRGRLGIALTRLQAAERSAA